MPHVRICAGGEQRCSSLPRPKFGATGRNFARPRSGTRWNPLLHSNQNRINELRAAENHSLNRPPGVESEARREDRAAVPGSWEGTRRLNSETRQTNPIRPLFSIIRRKNGPDLRVSFTRRVCGAGLRTAASASGSTFHSGPSQSEHRQDAHAAGRRPPPRGSQIDPLPSPRDRRPGVGENSETCQTNPICPLFSTSLGK